MGFLEDKLLHPSLGESELPRFRDAIEAAFQVAIGAARAPSAVHVLVLHVPADAGFWVSGSGLCSDSLLIPAEAANAG